MERKFDSMLIFDRPVYLDNRSIYGFVYNADELDSKIKYYPVLLDDFIKYVFGLEYWLKIGGTTSRDRHTWVCNKKRLNTNEKEVDEFCNMVYTNNPVKYFRMDKCYPNFRKKDLEKDFIITDNYRLWIK